MGIAMDGTCMQNQLFTAGNTLCEIPQVCVVSSVGSRNTSTVVYKSGIGLKAEVVAEIRRDII